MKEYKFRAYESGEMYYQVRVGGMFDNVATSPTYWHEQRKDWIHLIGDEYTKVMQYTGLKDKNDKEIYEGDILEGGYLNPLENKFLSRKYLIEYGEGIFKGILIGHSPYGDTLLKFINGEVIGNIYETPKLLEEI